MPPIAVLKWGPEVEAQHGLDSFLFAENAEHGCRLPENEMFDVTVQHRGSGHTGP